MGQQALRGPPVSQGEAMMVSKDPQGPLDLQEDPHLKFPEAHRLSIFLDPRDHLEHLDYRDTPQG